MITEDCKKGKHRLVRRVIGEVVQAYDEREVDSKHEQLAGDITKDKEKGCARSRNSIYNCCKDCTYAEPAYPEETPHERAKKQKEE